MRIVLALGRKALATGRRHSTRDGLTQAIAAFVTQVAPLCAAGHEVVITHASGPQDGWLALQAAATPYQPYPHAGVAGEEIGLISHMIADQLRQALTLDRRVATILTQVRVDLNDAAFLRPGVPHGVPLDEAEARLLAAERGWSIAREGARWRRMVASPVPLAVLEADVVRALLQQRTVVLCAGAGIPVAHLPDGIPTAIAAVIENDAASALLALQIAADRLLLLTNVDAVYADWDGSGGAAIPLLRSSDLAGIAMGAGSMLPKVRAACAFADRSGKPASIGRVDRLHAMLDGAAGTTVAAARA
jgi:carbamate kinase